MPRQAVPVSDDIHEGMTAYLDEMMVRLAFCLAVEHDRELQGAIRKLADCAETTPLYVMPSPTRSWLLLEENRPVHLVDALPDGGRRLAMNDLEVGHDIWREVFSAIARVRADERAAKMLAPIFNAGVFADRQSDRQIAEMGAGPRDFRLSVLHHRNYAGRQNASAPFDDASA